MQQKKMKETEQGEGDDGSFGPGNGILLLVEKLKMLGFFLGCVISNMVHFIYTSGY